MMRESSPIESVIYVAEKLGDLRDQVVFLGGAVVGLLVTDPGARPPRATKDVDVTIEIGSLTEFYALDATLLSMGFRNDMHGPTCRYEHGLIKLDIMPVNGEILGFTNRWYASAIQTSEMYRLNEALTIRLISAPSFLVTKLEAFRDPNREGNQDLFVSRDFGDVVRVVDGRNSIVAEVLGATTDLRKYVMEQIRWTLSQPYFEDALADHIDSGREDMVIARFRSLAQY